MRTANPALTARAFAAERSHTHNRHVMTVNGAVVKTGILTAVLVAAGVGAWVTVHPGDGTGSDPVARGLFGVAAPLAGFVIGLITVFVPRVSPVTAPLYAVCQGLFLGTVSSFFNDKYAGIALQAGLLTVGVLGLMLLAYVTGVLRATPRFTAGLLLAMVALIGVYLAAWLLPLLGVRALDPLFRGGPVGIGFSVIVVGIAALNLILDFDTIEQGARAAAPKYMEWYAAFGLLVTLVWLYLELLRLLAKIRSSD